MASFEVFRLQPRGAFHFGTQGVGLEATGERCPSDTLYSALITESLLGGPSLVRSTADEAIANLPFRLSSCFPYAGSALLFPLPRLRPVQLEGPQPGMRKRIKNLRYVSAAILRHLLAGGSLHDYLPPVDAQAPAGLYQQGSVLIAEADGRPVGVEKVWDTGRIDHVTVDRASEAANYYAVGQVRFAPECGLYVMAQTRDATTSAELLQLLTRLGHSGLGGRRSSGLGQFEVLPPASIDLPNSAGRDRAMLLSRYLPSEDELHAGVLGPGAAYDLTSVGGWLSSNDPRVMARRRRTIHLLVEGSVVACQAGSPPHGSVVNLAPDDTPFAHPVWRYGLALSIGVTAEERV